MTATLETISQFSDLSSIEDRAMEHTSTEETLAANGIDYTKLEDGTVCIDNLSAVRTSAKSRC